MSRACNRPPLRLTADELEVRAVPSALPAGGPAAVYVETNNPAAGQNAVLAYRRSPADGSLRLIGTFPTGGTGQLNVPKVVGPDDGDQQVQATPDGRFLYAVNQGSGTVTAFAVRANGGLVRVGTFDTGGVQPDSIGIAGRFLYVANRGDAAAGHPGTVAPSVSGFRIRADGSLTPLPNATIQFPVGTLATQTLVARGGRFLFVELATFQGAESGNSVVPLRIRTDGGLEAAPGGPANAGTGAPVLLGAAAHPFLNIVYTGFTSAGQVGVFTYDETGRTTFVGAAANSGAAPCWVTISRDGRLLYVANTGTDSVTVFSLADPLHPAQVQELPLAGPRSADGSGAGPRANVFQIDLDPSGRFLYAVTQASDPSFPQGNQLHTLVVAADGTLSEPAGPVLLTGPAVPANAHPQGVEVVALGKPSRLPADWFRGLGDLFPRAGEDRQP